VRQRANFRLPRDIIYFRKRANMVAEKILGNIKDYEINGRKTDKIGLEWYELEKKLLKKTTDSGEEIGIRLKHPPREGDILYADNSRIVAVELLPCELTVVRVNTMKEMGHLCFELGNRHLSLAIEDRQVTIPYDEPTFLYLERLGFRPERKEGKFRDFTVCHAHGH